MKNCLPTHLNISIGNNHQVKKAGDQGKRHPGRKSWSVVNFCAPTFWSPCWQSFPCCCWWPSGAPCPHYQRHLESAEAVYNCCTTERNYAECAALCTVGKGTYKIPWGHFMLYGVYAWRRFIKFAPNTVWHKSFQILLSCNGKYHKSKILWNVVCCGI